MADGDLEFITDTTDGRLGRNVVWHDPLNRNFPIRALVEDKPIVTKFWDRAVPVFNQQTESSCTAQAASGVYYTHPFAAGSDSTSYDEPTERYSLYREAQKHDPWEGQSYEGSSTDAPFKVLRDRGQIREWRWCFGLDDVLRTLSNHGPVAIGVNWYEGFFHPNADGWISPTGSLAGGHAVQLHANDADGRYVFGINSWGAWGIDGWPGWFRLSWDNLDRLLSENGEAVTIVI